MVLTATSFVSSSALTSKAFGASSQRSPVNRGLLVVHATANGPQNKGTLQKQQDSVSLPIRHVAAALAAVQILSCSVSGVAGAKLNTETFEAPPEGAGALVEYSDITDESSAGVVNKLKKYLPQVQAVLAEGKKDDGTKYSASILKELEIVADEITQLERQVKDGSNPSNVKSFASGIEQQINALKANVGFD